MTTNATPPPSPLNNSTTHGLPPSPLHNSTTPGLPYSPLQTVLILTFCLIVIAGTVVGNVLVCLAVAVVRRLRTPSNLLIVSLAVSDLLVALLVMSLAALYEVSGSWVLGGAVCHAWTSLDVLLCTASILSLCAISVDRYLLITRPFQYAPTRTPRSMAAIVVFVWVLSALISLPPLFASLDRPPEGGRGLDAGGWNLGEIQGVEGRISLDDIQSLEGRSSFVKGRRFDGERNFYEGGQSLGEGQIFEGGRSLGGEGGAEQCLLSQAIWYQIYATVGAFYLPLGVMIVIYTRIYLVSARIALAESRASSGGGARESDGQARISPRVLAQGLLGGGAVELNHNTDTSGSEPSLYRGLPLHGGPGEPPAGGRLKKSRKLKLFGKSRGLNRTASSHDRKATKTLGVIMGAFTACWLPFFLAALVKPFCVEPTRCVPPWLSSALQWLGYANSFLNPLIYARFNRDFRTPFREMLLCRCSDINLRLRTESYVEQYGAGGGAGGAGGAGGPGGGRGQRPSVDTVVRYNCVKGHAYVKVGARDEGRPAPPSDDKRGGAGHVGS